MWAVRGLIPNRKNDTVVLPRDREDLPRLSRPAPQGIERATRAGEEIVTARVVVPGAAPGC